MLKMQLLGHSCVKDAIKAYLRETGVMEVADVTVARPGGAFDEEGTREMERTLEMLNESIDFLKLHREKQSFFERIGGGKLITSDGEAERLAGETDIEEIWRRCSDAQNSARNARDELARSMELVRELEPWKDVGLRLGSHSTEGYEVQFWTLPLKAAEDALEGIIDRFPLLHVEECSREGGKMHLAVVLNKVEHSAPVEALKSCGGFRHSFEGLDGTPAEVIARERNRWESIEREIEGAEKEAKLLAGDLDKLMILSDHQVELIGLASVERALHQTDSVFLVEGWIRALDRKRVEKELRQQFQDIELAFRRPREDEEPPINLNNKPVARPFEFVTTLYGRPVYREIDPTPLLAPFFVLFFALCLTDAGYGLTLAAVSAVLLVRFKPSGGAAMLMRLLFMGGIVTAVIGVLTGGIFGIDASRLPAFIRTFVFINPLDEPMTMLNIAFLMGIVHILFGMGIRMTANFRAGLAADALFDDLLWILFLLALAPLGFSAILGGDVPPAVLYWSKRSAIVIAAAIFLTAGRKQKGIVKKFFKGLIGFYDVVGYFGDVLSYARLLALGLATSAIALAVNGIAGMVKGLPFYTGYAAAVVILVGGHTFNLAVNTLGSFVHSGRLQYLEFFSKFFTGGGREFRPYRSERRYTILRRSDH
jgi:V/A-type H+-transporting ATPase subunit I